MPMRILAVVAHPDDEIIGVGGTLCKHIDEGDDVKVIILGDGKTSRYNTYQKLTEIQIRNSKIETEQALDKLGIKNYQMKFLPNNRFDGIERLNLVKIVSKYINEFRPEKVYTHHIGDLNIDHRRCAEAVVIASRPIENPSVKSVLMFETLSSTEMGGYTLGTIFIPNYFVNIEKQLDRKLKAMACYKSELRDFPHPRSLESIKINAQLYGSKINIFAAEAFSLFRRIVN